MNGDSSRITGNSSPGPDVTPVGPAGDSPPGPTDRYSELVETVGGFFHDFKNHLGTITLNLELLLEDFQEPRDAREKRALAKLQRVQTECQRLVDVTNDFLRFARLTELERKPCDLTDVVEELIEFYQPTAEKAGITIIRLLPADLPPVLLHKEMFKQALLNLLLNAQQAMPGGGELTIQANLETRLIPREAQHGNAPADTVCLSIIDTGDGMSPEVASRVFRPFFTTRSGGTGLGLPMTRKIIEAHQGWIEVQSAAGRGTRFALHLQLAGQGTSDRPDQA